VQGHDYSASAEIKKRGSPVDLIWKESDILVVIESGCVTSVIESGNAGYQIVPVMSSIIMTDRELGCKVKQDTMY
jgi:hypothetical protein